jgi:hypothetical protein
MTANDRNRRPEARLEMDRADGEKFKNFRRRGGGKRFRPGIFPAAFAAVAKKISSGILPA